MVRKEHEGMADEMLDYLLHLIITMRNQKRQTLAWGRHIVDFIFHFCFSTYEEMESTEHLSNVPRLQGGKWQSWD